MHVGIFDTGSGSVGFSLVLLESGKVPLLKFTLRETFNPSFISGGESIVPLTLLAMKRLGDKIAAMSFPRPEEIHCFLAAHLVASRINVFEKSFDQPQAISEKFIHELLDRESEGTVEAEYGAQRIEDKIMQVRLNGYETHCLNSHTARDILVYSFVSLADKEFLDSIRVVLDDIFYYRPPAKFHSFGFSLYDVARGLLHDSAHSFLCIDIGSEITEVGFSKAGGLEKVVSFPGGKRSLLKNIPNSVLSGSSNIGGLRAWSRGHLDDNTFWKKVFNAGEEWFRRLLSEVVPKKEKHPEKIFLVADEEMHPIYDRLIREAYLSVGLSIEPEIHSINGNMLKDFVRNGSGFKDDAFLMSEAIFTNKILNV